MKVTGPSLRRRNHAWLQMRSPERRAARLARRQEVDDSSDDADSSGDESEDSGDESDDESGPQPTKTVSPPAVSASAGVQAGGGVVLLPTAGAKLAAGGSQLAAGDGDLESDGSESEGEESTSASATATSTTSERQILTLTPLPHSSTSTGLDELVTSLTRPLPTGQSTASGTTSVVSATSGPSVSVPATEAAQSGDPGDRPPPDRNARERQGSDSAVAPPSQTQSKLSSGAAAGIVIGVLAIIALLIGAALLWRKWRRDRGLPFFPEKRFRLRDDDGGPQGARSIGGPLPGKVGGPDHVKTNSQIMDDLLRAAYSAENGVNDMEGAFAPVKQPPQQEQAGTFMDEKAYVALAGPPPPLPPPAAVSVPVSQWLSEVKTPTQPNGPEIPPTPQMPPSATLPRPGLPYGTGGGRVPEPPRPAYFGRESMATETTNTTARRFG